MAVGTEQVWIPRMDKIGTITERAHRPNEDISWIAAVLRGLSKASPLFKDFAIYHSTKQRKCIGEEESGRSTQNSIFGQGKDGEQKMRFKQAIEHDF